jgi:hypothetical protein
MKHFSLVAIFLFIFLTSVFEASAQQEVSAYPQSDSPLQISKVSAKRGVFEISEGQQVPRLEVNYTLQNVSSKTIRAYSISLVEGDFSKPDAVFYGGLAIPAKSSQFISPNQLKAGSIVEASTNVRQNNVKIAVAFVEFSDGSTWGSGVAHYAPMLAGVRAGAKAAYEYLQTVERNDGIDAVIKALDELANLPPPKEQSEKQGSNFTFRTGAKAVGQRIKEVYEKEGIKAVESELQNNTLYNR